MIFSEALARIEELLKETVSAKSYSAHSELICEMLNLMEIYADSIVQLGKVAEQMRSSLQNIYDDEDNDYIGSDSADDYDKLMDGEEG